MNEPAVRPKKRKFWKYLLLTVLCGLLALAGVGWYATTASFRTRLRDRLISELQRITGGRVEVGSLHIVPFRLRVIVRGLTIHGLESPTDIPLFHAEEITATARIISFTSREFALERLDVERLLVHQVVVAVEAVVPGGLGPFERLIAFGRRGAHLAHQARNSQEDEARKDLAH